jgi:hypothetical protein
MMHVKIGGLMLPAKTAEFYAARAHVHGVKPVDLMAEVLRRAAVHADEPRPTPAPAAAAPVGPEHPTANRLHDVAVDQAAEDRAAERARLREEARALRPLPGAHRLPDDVAPLLVEVVQRPPAPRTPKEPVHARTPISEHGLGNKMSEADLDRMRELYRTGLSDTAIAREIGRSQPQVSKRLREFGLPSNSPKGRRS